MGAGDDGESQYVERKVPAGSFLRTEEVVTAKWRTSVQTGVIHKKQKDWETQEVKVPHCTTSHLGNLTFELLAFSCSCYYFNMLKQRKNEF